MFTTISKKDHPLTDLSFKGQGIQEIELVIPESAPALDLEFDGLSTFNIWSYGLGHFQNDVTSTILLFFLPLFLKEIAPIDDVNPGYWVGFVVVIGQVLDSLLTPLIGVLSDRTQTRIGKRKPWHIAGSIFTLLSFIFLLQPCRLCSTDAQRITSATIWFCLYDCGWAACQVSHMSLVPSLSVSRTRRDRLNTLRNSFTFIANFVGLLSILIVFSIVENPFNQFLVATIVTGGLGVIATVIFWIGVPEVRLVKVCLQKTREIQGVIKRLGGEEDNARKVNFGNQDEELRHMEMKFEEKGHKLSVLSDSHTPRPLNLRVWLTRPMFYQYGLVYMLTRLCYNISQNLLVFFLIFTLQVQEPLQSDNLSLSLYLAIFPLIIYLSSCCASFQTGRLFKKIGRKKTFAVGSIGLTICAVVMTFLTPETNYIFYPIAALYGAGQSLSMNAGTAFIAEVIGRKGQEGAIVYGLYSFLDKIANGLVFFFLLQSSKMEENDSDFIRYVTAWVPSSCSILGCILVLFGEAPDYKTEEDQQNRLLEEFVE